MLTRKVIGIIVYCACACCLFGAERDTTDRRLDEILAELKQMRAMLDTVARQPRAAPAQQAHITLNLKDVPKLGSDSAPFTVVEFMDFQCSYCRQFHARTFQDLKKLYIDTGQVRFFVRDLPLDIHAQALPAAEAARCAAAQGKFWPFYELMESEEKLDSETIIDAARKAHLEVDAFEDCVKTEKYRSEIQTLTAEMISKGMHATPTFVVGKTSPSGVEDGDVIVGAAPLGVFEERFRSMRGTTKP